jgi:hypothetical protein
MPNSTITNNYVHDIGSQGISSYAYYAGQSVNGTVIENNVVLRAVQRMSDGGAIYIDMQGDPKGSSYTIENNVYWNYAPGGLVFSNGTITGDSDPIHENPQISGWTYKIASDSPVFNSPIAFPPIVGGWGPQDYVIPETGTAPSSL